MAFAKGRSKVGSMNLSTSKIGKNTQKIPTGSGGTKKGSMSFGNTKVK